MASNDNDALLTSKSVLFISCLLLFLNFLFFCDSTFCCLVCVFLFQDKNSRDNAKLHFMCGYTSLEKDGGLTTFAQKHSFASVKLRHVDNARGKNSVNGAVIAVL